MFEKPKVFWLKIGKRYEAYFDNYFEQAGYEVVDLTDLVEVSLLLESFAMCTPDIELSMDSSLLVDIENTEALNEIVRASSLTSMKNLPKIIVITDLLTFANGRQNFISSDDDHDAVESFSSRIPASCSFETYHLENALWEYSSLVARSLSFTFLGLGVIYGETGFDMETQLVDFWSKTMDADASSSPEWPFPTLFKIAANDDVSVPMIHIADFAHTLEEHLRHGNPISPSFIPAMSAITIAGSGEHGEEAKGYEGGSGNDSNNDGGIRTAGILSRSGATLVSATPASVLEDIIRDPSLYRWNISVPSSSSSSPTTSSSSRYIEAKRCTSFTELWEEFIDKKGMLPCKIVIAGAPFSGKTEWAKELSTAIQVPIVTVADALKFLATSPLVRHGDDVEVKAGLVKLIEAKFAAAVADPKKGGGKKDAAANTATGGQELDLSTFDYAGLIPTLVGTQDELIRRSISVNLRLDPVIFNKGAVIDIWNYETSFASATGLEETMKGSSKGSVVFLELQTSLATASTRFLAANSWGDDAAKGKLSKDAQAAVKNFETTFNGYYAKLVVKDTLPPDNDPDGGNSGAGAVAGAVTAGGDNISSMPPVLLSPEEQVSHPLLVELEQQSSSCIVIHQHQKPAAADTAATANNTLAMQQQQQLSTAVVVNQIIDARGPFAWLASASAAAATGIEEQHMQQEQSPRSAAAHTAAMKSFVIEDGLTPLGPIVTALAAVSASAEDSTAPPPPASTAAASQNGDDEKIAAISKNLSSSLGATEQAALFSNLTDLQRYLVANVLEELTKAMVDIKRKRPEDPIRYLMDHLNQAGVDLEARSEQHAREKFYGILSEAAKRRQTQEQQQLPQSEAK